MVLGALTSIWGPGGSAFAVANDNWANAISVCGSPQLSTTNNCNFTANVTTDATLEFGEFWHHTVWYSLTAASTGTSFIRASSPQDNTLHIRDSSGTLLASNDDSYGVDAAIVISLNAGSTYLVGVGSYSSGTALTASVSVTMRRPDPPTNVVATLPGVSGAVNVSWTSADIVTNSVTGFTIESWANGSLSSTQTITGSPPATNRSLTGLTDGTTYTFCVKATNVVGTSNCSTASNAVVPPNIAQTVTFPPPTTKTFGDAPFSISATSNVSGATVSFTSSTPLVCQVSGQTVTLVGSGDCTIVATGSAQPGWLPGTASNTFSVVTANQSSLVISAPATTGSAGQRIALTTTGGSGAGTVTWSSGSSSACTVDDSGNVTITSGEGTCSVTATKAGDGGYNPTTSDTLTITVQPASQTISITDPGTVRFGSGSITLVLAGAQTSPATWSTSTPTVCSVSATTGELSIIAAGTCEVAASVPGSSMHATSTTTRTIVIETILPATGSPTSPMKSIALVLLALGGVAVVYRRRPDEPLFARR